MNNFDSNLANKKQSKVRKSIDNDIISFIIPTYRRIDYAVNFYIFDDYSKWWYNQLKLTNKYYIENSKPCFSKLFKLFI